MCVCVCVVVCGGGLVYLAVRHVPVQQKKAFATLSVFVCILVLCCRRPYTHTSFTPHLHPLHTGYPTHNHTYYLINTHSGPPMEEEGGPCEAEAHLQDSRRSAGGGGRWVCG